ncbi:MAG: MauE/DoxX family redox-associated membrane protein [Solirubrobacteraceae bacterium]
MTQALAPPLLVAALLLCVAGGLKLRSPGRAAAALQVSPWTVRGLACGEVALGAGCALFPSRPLAAALAVVYGLFSLVAVVLMRRGVPCGCFGDNDLPVSLAHVIASGLLSALALGAALTGPRGLDWLLDRPALQAAVLIVGVAGALYATVAVYTQLPAAWSVWSGE